MLEKLNLPEFKFKFIQENKKTKIFDAIRGKYVVLNPEEWVRQNFVQFLIQHKSYPKGLMAVEKGLKLNELQKRADLLVFQKEGNPIALFEFKASNIPINQAVFDQIARYNMVYKVPYLIVSNGMQHFCAMINFEEESYVFLKDLPEYHEL